MNNNYPGNIAALQQEALEYYKDTYEHFLKGKICMPVGDHFEIMYKFDEFTYLDYLEHFKEVCGVYIQDIPNMIASLEKELTGDPDVDKDALLVIADFHFQSAYYEDAAMVEEPMFVAIGSSDYIPRIDQLVEVETSRTEPDERSHFDKVRTILILKNGSEVDIGHNYVYQVREAHDKLNKYYDMPIELVECLARNPSIFENTCV